MTTALLLSALATVFTVSLAPEDTGCTAGYGGTCHSLGTGCNGEHPDNEWFKCVVAENCTEIPHYGSCHIDCHTVAGEQNIVAPTSRPYNLTLEATATNPECFSVRVRWEQPSDTTGALWGFRIESTTEDSYGSIEQCACLSDPDARDFALHGLQYGGTPSQLLTMTVKVMSLPYSEQEPLTITQPVPTSCRELPYEPGRCIPPRYTTVQNITFTTTLSGNPDEMRIHLSWAHPNTPSSFPPPSTYYVLITDPMVSILPIRYFRVEDTLNVTLPPLDASKSYKVTIQPYVHCAGVDDVKNGCGLKRTVDVSYTPPIHTSPVVKASSPTSTAPPFTPAPATMSLKPSSPTFTTPPPKPAEPNPTGIRNDIILPSIITPIAIAVIGIAVLAYTRTRRKNKKNKCPEAIYPITNSHAPLTSTLTYTPHVCQPILAGLPVLLVYSPESPEKEKQVLMEILVKGLKPYDIDVTSHDVRSPRGSLSEWVGQQFQKATAVLVVCNQHLFQEWQGSGSTHTVVAALKELLHASVGTSEFSKIAVVLLKAKDEEFIPTPYLRGAKQFTVHVDMVADIARFIKEIPVYVKP